MFQVLRLIVDEVLQPRRMVRHGDAMWCFSNPQTSSDIYGNFTQLHGQNIAIPMSPSDSYRLHMFTPDWWLHRSERRTSAAGSQISHEKTTREHTQTQECLRSKGLTNWSSLSNGHSLFAPSKWVATGQTSNHQLTKLSTTSFSSQVPWTSWVMEEKSSMHALKLANLVADTSDTGIQIVSRWNWISWSKQIGWESTLKHSAERIHSASQLLLWKVVAHAPGESRAPSQLQLEAKPWENTCWFWCNLFNLCLPHVSKKRKHQVQSECQSLVTVTDVSLNAGVPVWWRGKLERPQRCWWVYSWTEAIVANVPNFWIPKNVFFFFKYGAFSHGLTDGFLILQVSQWWVAGYRGRSPEESGAGRNLDGEAQYVPVGQGTAIRTRPASIMFQGSPQNWKWTWDLKALTQGLWWHVKESITYINDLQCIILMNCVYIIASAYK